MLLYGDEVALFKGVVRQKRPSSYDIYFSDLHEEVVVPRYVLKSPIQEEVGVEQEIKMPLWYMRKNRLIPLTPDFRGLPNFWKIWFQEHKYAIDRFPCGKFFN